MADDPMWAPCSWCGHTAYHHRYGDPPRCAKCPDGICQPKANTAASTKRQQ